MTEDPQFIGSWKQIKILGRGGFGQVTLWLNVATNQYLALKKLREVELNNVIKTKQKERWAKEVEMMHKLGHENVVTALPIPEELKSLATSSLPMLAMEYCVMGDLRQLLNRPENCCGLREPAILAILKDVPSGLAYLHSCKVIHRDLKPDNIVLQNCGGRVVYKLTDLGYAKELDQNSVCESFVGTIQYLAPELFQGKSYTASVDYWSLGLVAYEVLTGYRPFLPGVTPANWMKQIQNKSRTVISVSQTGAGEVVHSSRMAHVTHANRCLKEKVEKWLQLALDWSGATRGRDPDTKELRIFDSLAAAVASRWVAVFSVPGYETLSYEVTAETTVLALQGWLCRDCGLELDDQVLLTAGGKALPTKGGLLQALDQTPSLDGVSVFLCTSGVMKPRQLAVVKPAYVKDLLEDPKKLLEYRHLKRSCSDSVFFLQTRAQLYTLFIEAIKAKIENIKHRTAAVQTLFEDVNEEWTQVETFAQFLILSHKTDLENYIQLRKSGELASSGMVQKWIQKVNDVETKLAELRTSSNKNQQKLAVTQARQNCGNLEGSALMQPATLTAFHDIVEEGHRLWDKVEKIPRDVRGISMSNTDMVKVLYRCLELDSKLLKSPVLDLLCTQILEAEEHLAKLVSPLTIWLKSTKIMKQIIENTQKDRQKEVWTLIAKGTPRGRPKEPEVDKAKPETEAPAPAPKKEPDGFSPFHIPKTVHNQLPSPVTEAIVVKPDFKVMEPVSIQPRLDSKFSSFPAEPQPRSMAHPVDSSSIICDNQSWRFRTQDLTHSCHQMMKEIQSLNWDFLTED